MNVKNWKIAFYAYQLWIKEKNWIFIIVHTRDFDELDGYHLIRGFVLCMDRCCVGL